MALEDVLDGGGSHAMPEVLQRSLDPLVAPGRVLPGHAEGEVGDVR